MVVDQSLLIARCGKFNELTPTTEAVLVPVRKGAEHDTQD